MVDISHYTEMMIEGLSKKIHALEEKLNTAENERDEARRELCVTLANLWLEGGCVPDKIKEAEWFDWDFDSPRFHAAIASQKGWLTPVLEKNLQQLRSPYERLARKEAENLVKKEND